MFPDSSRGSAIRGPLPNHADKSVALPPICDRPTLSSFCVLQLHELLNGIRSSIMEHGQVMYQHRNHGSQVMKHVLLLALTGAAKITCAQSDRSTFFFAEHSGELSPGNIERLDSLCLLINTDLVLKEKVVFNLYGYASPAELKVAPSIDEDRARAVAQYMMTHCIPDSAMWHVVDVTNLRKDPSGLSAVGITTGGRR